MAKTIRFKSTSDNWRKEYLGLKCNTLRQFDDKTDIRLEILTAFINDEWTNINIEIENTDTCEVFNRRVTDVSKYNNHYIISWLHSFDVLES